MSPIPDRLIAALADRYRIERELAALAPSWPGVSPSGVFPAWDA